MGPYKKCREMHCVCSEDKVLSFLDELAELDRQRQAQLREHYILRAMNDPAYLRFMAKLLNG